MPTEDNIYGDNAIVGNKEDATKILEGREVDIKSSNTQTIKLNADDAPKAKEGDDQKQPTDDKKPEDKQEELTPEQQLAEDIQKTKQAEEDVKKELQTKGINFDDVANEWETNGQLSSETFQKLEQAGYPKSVVDAYIRGVAATAEQFTNTVYGYAGGKDGFDQMTQFVISQGQAMVNTFNNVVATGDLPQIQLAIQGIKAQMASKFGTANRTVMGSGNKSTGVQGFESKSDMQKAMADKRYGRDPQYTREVEQKTMRSNFLR